MAVASARFPQPPSSASQHALVRAHAGPTPTRQFLGRSSSWRSNPASCSGRGRPPLRPSPRPPLRAPQPSSPHGLACPSAGRLRLSVLRPTSAQETSESPEKIRQKLSLASPNPSGVRAGERQFPPSPRARRRGLVALRAWRMATKDACFPPTSSERSVGAVEPHALERYCQALPAHGTPRMSQDQSRPNVLLIVTDQQRGDCLGIDGHPVLQTPAMDWLGASGTFFRRGYSECPSCIPARRVLMSGRPPDEDGMVGFMSAPWDPPATLAGELRAAGYETPHGRQTPPPSKASTLRLRRHGVGRLHPRRRQRVSGLAPR